jgi:hypothetical protein
MAVMVNIAAIFFIINLDIVGDFISFKKEDKCLRKRLELV